jgi:hypothetical protein
MSDEIYVNIGNAINSSPDTVKKLIENYDTEELPFFEELFGNLDDIVKNPISTMNMSSKINGTNSVIRKNTELPIIYKTIIHNPHRKSRIDYLKSIFKELIIQITLQSDPIYGKNICKLYKMYKRGNNCVLQMEALETTLNFLFKNRNDSNINTRTNDLKGVLIYILEMLLYLQNNYNFYHNDLHFFNIMSSTRGNIIDNIKLIDFGSSSITINGSNLGTKSESFNDGFNIISSAVLYNISPEYKSKLYELQNLPSNTQLETYLEALKTSVGGRIASNIKKSRKSRNMKRRKTRRTYTKS